jgi:hypothetical protein
VRTAGAESAACQIQTGQLRVSVAQQTPLGAVPIRKETNDYGLKNIPLPYFPVWQFSRSLGTSRRLELVLSRSLSPARAVFACSSASAASRSSKRHNCRVRRVHRVAMAAMSGGLHGAGGDHEEDHKIQTFRTAMRKFQEYPFNLNARDTLEKVKLVHDFRRHFDQTKDDILLVLDENVRGIRRKLIEKKIRVEFYDAGLGDSSTISTPPSTQGERERERDREREREPPSTASRTTNPGLEWGESSASSWDVKDDTESYFVSNSESLEGKFGIKSLRSSTADRRPRNRNRNPPPDDQPDFEPLADPVCRFMYVTHHQSRANMYPNLSWPDSLPHLRPTRRGSRSRRSCCSRSSPTTRFLPAS